MVAEFGSDGADLLLLDAAAIVRRVGLGVPEGTDLAERYPVLSRQDRSGLTPVLEINLVVGDSPVLVDVADALVRMGYDAAVAIAREFRRHVGGADAAEPPETDMVVVNRAVAAQATVLEDAGRYASWTPPDGSCWFSMVGRAARDVARHMDNPPPRITALAAMDEMQLRRHLGMLLDQSPQDIAHLVEVAGSDSAYREFRAELDQPRQWTHDLWEEFLAVAPKLLQVRLSVLNLDAAVTFYGASSDSVLHAVRTRNHYMPALRRGRAVTPTTHTPLMDVSVATDGSPADSVADAAVGAAATPGPASNPPTRMAPSSRGLAAELPAVFTDQAVPLEVTQSRLAGLDETPPSSADVLPLITKAFPALGHNPHAAIWLTLPVADVLGELATAHSETPAWRMYEMLMRGEAAVSTSLLADRVQWLREQLVRLGDDPDTSVVDGLLTPTLEWRSFAVDQRSVAEAVRDPRVVPDLSWLTRDLPSDVDRTADLQIPTNLGDVSDWIRARIAAGKSPVPFFVDDAADEAASLVPFGVEIEFDLVENDPDVPWSFVPVSVRQELIGRDLYAAGLTDSPTQHSYHEPGVVPTAAFNGWRYTHDPTVHGEVVSPVMTSRTAATWRSVHRVVEIIAQYGARPTARAGAHVHVGTGGERSTVERLSEWFNYFVEEAFRLSTNPREDEHRGTTQGVPDWTPSSEHIPDAERLFDSNRPTKTALNVSQVRGEPSDHVEFRLFDASLHLGTIQAQVKWAIGMVLASMRGRPVAGPARDLPFYAALVRRANREKGWRVTDLAAGVEAERLWELLATMFSRPVDMLQEATLFHLNTWMLTPGTIETPGPVADAGPVPPPSGLAVLLARHARVADIRYPWAITLQLTHPSVVFSRIAARSDVGEERKLGSLFGREIRAAGGPGAVLTKQDLVDFYALLAGELAAVPETDRNAWITNRIAANRAERRRLGTSSVADWISQHDATSAVPDGADPQAGDTTSMAGAREYVAGWPAGQRTPEIHLVRLQHALRDAILPPGFTAQDAPADPGRPRGRRLQPCRRRRLATHPRDNHNRRRKCRTSRNPWLRVRRRVWGPSLRCSANNHPPRRTPMPKPERPA